jgi:hypothetical protein
MAHVASLRRRAVRRDAIVGRLVSASVSALRQLIAARRAA